MTNLRDDILDPAEARLTRRVRAYADAAVVPIDPVAIAASAAATRPRHMRSLARFDLVFAGAAAVAVVVATGAMLFGRGPSNPGAVATASASAAVTACTPYDVDAVITRWDGAAGHRIAAVELHHVGTDACSVDPLPQPWLADGRGEQLIVGTAGAGAPISFAPGEVLATLVDVDNYCGPDPAAPVTVAFIEADVAVFVATALTPTDLTGVPPCTGPGRPGSIQMHPWSFAAP